MDSTLFWNNLKKCFLWLVNSADNHSNGASGRKLTVIVIVFLIIQGHQKWITPENYYDIDLSDKAFVAVLLGIVTMEQIIKFKSGKEEVKLEVEKNTAQNDPIV